MSSIPGACSNLMWYQRGEFTASGQTFQTRGFIVVLSALTFSQQGSKVWPKVYEPIMYDSWMCDMKTMIINLPVSVFLPDVEPTLMCGDKVRLSVRVEHSLNMTSDWLMKWNEMANQSNPPFSLQTCHSNPSPSLWGWDFWSAACSGKLAVGGQ